MGEHAISTTQRGTQQPHERSISAGASSGRPASSVVSTGILTAFVVALFAASVAAAAPALAVDDPSRPDARVTHGPSCRPGGLVIEVHAGRTAYSVRLATSRTPAGEDEAVVQPGDVVVLQSADVAYGETIDGRLEYAAQDGSGVTFVDELEDYSFTRPSKEDCDAVAAPASPEPVSPEPVSPEPVSPEPVRPTTSAPAPAPPAQPGDGGALPPPTASRSPDGHTPTPAVEAGQQATSAPTTGERVIEAPSIRVAVGGTVTLLGSGFLPGEEVTVRLHGFGPVLGTAVAGTDGTVRLQVRIPSGTATGSARVDLVGNSSDVTSGVALQVAAEQRATAPRGTLSVWALLAAAVALVGSVWALVSVAGQQRTAARAALGLGGAALRSSGA